MSFVHTKAYFTERQYFRQWWIIVIFLLLNLLFAYALVTQVIMGIPFGNNPMSNGGLIAVLIFMTAFAGLFFSINLHTRVYHDGIHLRFFPFFRKKSFLFKEIEEATVRQYKPLIEFGGWGLRANFSGVAYTISGNQGLQLKLKNGKQFLIGTRKPEELAKAIKAAMLPLN